MNDHGVRFDRVENAKGKPGDEGSAKFPKLHRPGFGMAGDERNRGIHTPDEMEPRPNAAAFIPKARFRHVVLRAAANDERMAH